MTPTGAGGSNAAGDGGARNPVAVAWEFARPFTLVAPALGMVAGAGAALGSSPRWVSDFDAGPLGIALSMAAGGVMAAVLNAASNGLNQIFDLEIDRVNKPKRPLPSGSLSLAGAWGVTLGAYALALALAASVNEQCLLLVLAAAAFTVFYSAPPLRTKRWWWAAAITIAVPRGVLLKVAGWSCVKTALDPEPWFLGGIFGLFLLGATTTKDFADMQGDREAGCETLPIRFGVRRSIWMIAPFFVLPFLLLPVGGALGILTADPTALTVLGVVLAAWGAWVVRLMAQDPDRLSDVGENHPSWRHMYLMMFTAQAGSALAYLV